MNLFCTKICRIIRVKADCRWKIVKCSLVLAWVHEGISSCRIELCVGFLALLVCSLTFINKTRATVGLLHQKNARLPFLCLLQFFTPVTWSFSPNWTYHLPFHLNLHYTSFCFYAKSRFSLFFLSFFEAACLFSAIGLKII